MAAIFAFRCACCGAIHEGSPSFGFDAPWHWQGLSAADRERATLKSDTCVIPHPDGVDRFLRGVLEIPIEGIAEPFLWGVWVSLSESSFARCLATWDDPDEDDVWFGWFCNRLPYYPDTLNLKTRVHPRKGGERPWIELADCEHPLAVDYHRGLSRERAQRIAEQARHAAEGPGGWPDG